MDLPKTQEEFNLYFFDKLNKMETSNETMHGDVRVAIAHHEALEDRVDAIVDDAKSAKKWENGKFLVTYAIQGLYMLFRGTHHGA